MDIRGYANTAYSAIANGVSSVCGFGKDWLGKGFSAGCSLLGKVSQVAQQYIPNTVSNTVREHPKSLSFVAGLGVAGVSAAIIYKVFHRCNGGTPPPRNNTP